MRVLMRDDFYRVTVKRPEIDVVFEISRTLLDRHPELEVLINRITPRALGTWPCNMLVVAEGETVYLPHRCCLDPESESGKTTNFLVKLGQALASQDLYAARKQNLLKTFVIVPNWWCEEAALNAHTSLTEAATLDEPVLRLIENLAYVFFHCLMGECPEFLTGISEKEFIDAAARP
ncbi:MAG: hypothetical protein HYV27_09335 [Candidatus Hydrogenedentes bacterium]|nr:hypothetical protein [Candidatus Hydrogenedentota bacterium]